MHLIHVWIVASAVPLLTAFSYQGTQSLQHRQQQAFHDAETAPADEPFGLAPGESKEAST